MHAFLPAVFLVALGCGADGPGRSGWELSPCTLPQVPPSAIFELEQRVAEEGGWELHFGGLVMAGPAPGFHTTLLEDDHCRYGYYVPTTCEPACEDAFCVDGDCVAWPEGLSAGTVTLEGLGGPISLEMTESWPGRYFESVELELGSWGAGSELRVTASGDAFPALELRALGVETTVTPIAESGVIWDHDEAVHIVWEAGEQDGACVGLQLYTMAYGHGTPVANVLECVVEDTGGFTVPDDFVQLFPEWDTPGVCVGNDCPYSELRRFTRSAVETTAGVAELVVLSEEGFALKAPD
jgi:hypothetical protein